MEITQEGGEAPPEKAGGVWGSRHEAPRPSKPSRFTLDRVVRFVLGAGVAALVVWLLSYFASLVVYLMLGLVVAYLLRPLVNRIQGIGLGRIPAILATFVVVVGVISLLLTFLVPFVARQMAELSQQVTRKSAVQIVTNEVPSTATGQTSLRPGEYVVEVDGVTIRESGQLQRLLRTRQPGQKIIVEVRDREEATRTVEITMGAASAPDAQAGTAAAEEGLALPQVGLLVRTVLFSDLVPSIENWLRKFVPMQEGAIVAGVTSVFETLFRADRITQFAGSIVVFLSNVFYAVLVVPFVAFFVLKDGARIRQSLLQLVPNPYFEITLAIYEKVETNIGRYFRGLLIQCLSIGTVATILLTVVGLDSALAVGIFAGLANTIPYFGPLMGFLAGTLVGVAQTGDFSLVPGILVAMALTQIADNVLFQPLIFSRVAQAHPLVILFVVLIGAQLGGIIGMLVAIPLMTIVRVMVQQILWSLRNYRIFQTTR